jgi:hypothetical protein
MLAQAHLANEPSLIELRDPTEEPYAVVPHVGICEGASRQRLVLP